MTDSKDNGIKVETKKKIVIDLKKFRDGTCKIAELDDEKLAVCKSGSSIYLYPVDE